MVATESRLSSGHTAARLAVEEFVYREAFLLDAWELDDWLTLFDADCRYEVSPTGYPKADNLDSKSTLFLVGDNRERLEQRIIRLKKKNAHVEFPHSMTRHMYSNVLVLEDKGNEVVATANCCTFRTKNSITSTYPGRIHYVLKRSGDSFLIKSKRIMLDLENLVPQGKVSILL